jgi:hypothetical protein
MVNDHRAICSFSRREMLKKIGQAPSEVAP